MRNSTSQTFAVLRAPATALFLLILGFPGLYTALPCSPPPGYTLTTSVIGQGSVSPAWGSFTAGTILSLTATPEQGWVFDHWEGALSGSTNPASLTMNSNKSVTAVFVQGAVLTTSVQGSGSVSPSGGTYTLNQQISITATPGAGLRFDHWAGALSGSSNPASLTMDGDKSVTAVFLPVILDLYLDDDPNGSFDIEPLGVPLSSNEWQYDYGTVVSITATPPANHFVRWWEDFEWPIEPVVTWGEDISIVMNQDRTFIVTFIPGNVINIAIVGTGQVDVSPDEELYHSPSAVSLTAVPAEDWYFDHWEGDLTGNLNPASLEFNFEDFYVTAVFVDDYFDLALSVNDVNAGSVGASPSPGPQGYGSGTVVSLAPTANPGWRFDHWTGDITGSTNPASVTMDADKSITAVFVEDYYNLSMSVNDTNGGTVVASPGPAPQGYASGTPVTISATANPGWRFDHWEGALTGSTNPDTITMDSDKTVTAVFVQEFTLTTTVQGSGGIEQSLAGDVFAQGTQVTLTAVANETWHFDHWEGAATGTNEVTTVTMDSDKSVTAVFLETYYLLSLDVNDPGRGSVTPSPLPGPQGYRAGTTVTLAATANPGFAFSHWSGDLGTTSNPDTILMDANKAVTAVFIPLRLLDVSTEADPCLPGVSRGNVNITPSFQHLAGSEYSDNCVEGQIYEISDQTTVMLTAEPESGAVFDHWEGAVTGSDNPVNVLMDANKEVRAVFTPQFVLTVNVVGTGTVSPESGVYDAGSVINLTATPTGQDVYFVEWQGDVAGSSNPVVLNLDSDKTVTAVFAKMYQVNTSAEGNGAVTPESGLFGEGTEIELSAIPESNWAFNQWCGDVPSGIDRQLESIAVTVDHAMDIYAQFIERPGLTDLDMIGDLNFFLQDAGESATAADFDRNGIDYDASLNHIYVGNGIPDAAELSLIESVLKTRHLSHTYKDGICHEVLWNAWQTNLAQAGSDLSGHDQRTIRVVAGYMTIGDFDSVECIRNLVHSSFAGVTVDPANYDLSAQRYLYFRRDADNDGVSNLMEWQAASPTGSLDDVQSFSGAATNGDPPANPPLPPAPAGDCGNAECLERGILTANVQDSTIVPGNSTAVSIPSGEDTILGTSFSVRAKPDTEHGWGFTYWSFDKSTGQRSMLYGSRNTADFDVLQGDLDLYAVFRRHKLGVANDCDDFTIGVECHGGAFETVDDQGDRIVYGPSGSSVTLTVRNLDPTKRYLWNVASSPGFPNPKFTYSTSVRIPVTYWTGYGYARPELIPPGTNLPAMKQIQVSSTQGGTAMGAMGIDGQGGAFLDAFTTSLSYMVLFTAVPDDGWEFVEWQFEGTSPFTRTTSYVSYQPAEDIDRAKAIFRPNAEYMLDIEIENANGGSPQCAGYVRTNSGKRYYRPTDGSIMLTAVPAPGYMFKGWEGTFLLPTATNPLMLNVGEYGINRTIKAIFANDSVRLMQDTRRIRDYHIDLDEDNIPDDVALLSTNPSMPNLVASLDEQCGEDPIEWRLEITFQPDKQDRDVFRIPDNDPTIWYEGTTWNIRQALGANFRGGDAVLYYRYGGGLAESFHFRIWGTNPPFSGISAALAAPAPYENKYRAVAWHESGYKQFLPEPNPGVAVPEGGGIGMPLPCYARDGGYGIMQVTIPRPTIEQIWNWRANTTRGQNILDQAATQSSNHLNYLNTHRFGEEPLPDPPLTMTAEQTLLDSFSIYRSGEYYYSRQRVPDTPAEYILVPLSHVGVSYANARRQEMESAPWE